MEQVDLQKRISELQTQMAATLDGYALAKAQLRQMQMLAEQLQEQNKELSKYKESNEDYKTMLENKTSPKPKKKKAPAKKEG